MDIVWDTYIPTSIKAATREKRGKGARQKVVGMNKLPSNWKCFSVKKPIKEFFHFLSEKVASSHFDYYIGV